MSLYFLSASQDWTLDEDKRHSPVRAVEVPLDVVTLIVDQENDWGEPMVDHSGKFLDTELPAN